MGSAQILCDLVHYRIHAGEGPPKKTFRFPVSCPTPVEEVDLPGKGRQRAYRRGTGGVIREACDVKGEIPSCLPDTLRCKKCLLGEV